MLLSPAGKAVGGILAVLAVSGAIYAKGRLDGRASVLSGLADDRITILKDGKEIDDEVLAADDDLLCALLGGCGLPDEP
jgi:hypothetical protein